MAEFDGVPTGNTFDVEPNLTLAGHLDVQLVNGFTLDAGQSFEIIDFDSAATFSGTFANFAEGDVVLSDSCFNLAISYVGGNGDDVVLTTVPINPGTGDVVLDDFEATGSGSAHNSDGSTVALCAPPNFFSDREMDGSANSNLIVNGGGISGVFLAGETAYIEWTNAIGTATFDDLLFENFVGKVLDNATYAISLNGSQIGMGTFDSGMLDTDPSTINPGDTLRITLTSGTGGFVVFNADGITVVPPVDPPANDNFASTFSLGNLFPLNTTGSNVVATVEAGEQQLENTGATVWWFFTAPADGTVTIDTFGSDFDTQLHIYDGFFDGAGPADLNPVTNNDDAGGTTQSEVTFAVTAGACYEIRVGGFDADGGGAGNPAAQGNIVLGGTFEPDMGFLVGDVNCDGFVNLLDVSPFVDLISTGQFNPKADINEDGIVNLLDVGPFVALLSGT